MNVERRTLRYRKWRCPLVLRAQGVRRPAGRREKPLREPRILNGRPAICEFSRRQLANCFGKSIPGCLGGPSIVGCGDTCQFHFGKAKSDYPLLFLDGRMPCLAWPPTLSPFVLSRPHGQPGTTSRGDYIHRTRNQRASAGTYEFCLSPLMGSTKPADITVGDKRGRNTSGRNDAICSNGTAAKAPFQNGTNSCPGAIRSLNSMAVSEYGGVSFGTHLDQLRQGGYPPYAPIDDYARTGWESSALSVAGMAQKRPNARQKEASGEPCARDPKMEQISLPAELHPISDELLLAMHPGDIVFLDDSGSLRPLVETAFFAVLSCPGCGTLGLITIPQYWGVALVICGSDSCSCQFRIVEKSRLQYLPAS